MFAVNFYTIKKSTECFISISICWDIPSNQQASLIKYINFNHSHNMIVNQLTHKQKAKAERQSLLIN